MKVSAERLSVLREISVTERLTRTLKFGSCLNLGFVQQLMKKYLNMDSYEFEEATRVFLEFQRYKQEESLQAAQKLTRLLMTLNQMQVEIRKLGEKPSRNDTYRQELQRQILFYQERMKVWQSSYAERLKEIYHIILQYEGADPLLLKEQETITRKALEQIYTEICTPGEIEKGWLQESRRGQVYLAIAKPYHRMLARSIKLSHMMDYKERWRVAVDYQFQRELQIKKQHLQEWIRNMEQGRFRESAESLDSLERGQETSILNIFRNRLSRFRQENKKLLEAQPESIRLMNYKLPVLEAIGQIQDDKSLDVVWTILKTGRFILEKDGLVQGKREEKTRYLQEIIQNMEEENWLILYQSLRENDLKRDETAYGTENEKEIYFLEIFNQRFLNIMEETNRQMFSDLVEQAGDIEELEVVLQLLSKESLVLENFVQENSNQESSILDSEWLLYRTKTAQKFVSLEEEKERVKKYLLSLEKSHWEVLYQTIEKNYLEKKQREQNPIKQNDIEKNHTEIDVRNYELHSESNITETIENRVKAFYERLSQGMNESRRQALLEWVEEISEDGEMEVVLQLLSKESRVLENFVQKNSNQESSILDSEWLLYRTKTDQKFVSLEEEKERVQKYLKSLEESHWETLYQIVDKKILNHYKKENEQNRNRSIKQQIEEHPEEWAKERVPDSSGETGKQTLLDLVQTVENTEQFDAVLELLEHKSYIRQDEKQFLINFSHSLSRQEKDLKVLGYGLRNLVQEKSRTEVISEEFRYDAATLITVRPPVAGRQGTMQLSEDIEYQISSQVHEEVEDIQRTCVDKISAGDSFLSSGQLESLVEKMELYQKELQEIKMMQTKLLKTTNSNQLINQVMRRLQGELKVERLRRGLS